MCDPVSATIAIGTIAGAAFTKHENDKAESRARQRAETNRKQQAAERNAQERNTLSEATPLLIKKGGSSAKGLASLRAQSGGGATGSNNLGLGGDATPGLNITKV